jgi:hypothetical protein
MNYEKYGRSTASAQYFLQLAGYLGIPVIAWNADNSGLERVRHILHVTFKHSNKMLSFNSVGQLCVMMMMIIIIIIIIINSMV